MAEKKKYLYKDTQVDGQPLTFETKAEQWTLYTLEDGSQLKVKLVLTDVARLDTFDANGVPVYLFSAQQVVGLEPNSGLMKKAD